MSMCKFSITFDVFKISIKNTEPQQLLPTERIRQSSWNILLNKLYGNEMVLLICD